MAWVELRGRGVMREQTRGMTDDRLGVRTTNSCRRLCMEGNRRSGRTGAWPSIERFVKDPSVGLLFDGLRGSRRLSCLALVGARGLVLMGWTHRTRTIACHAAQAHMVGPATGGGSTLSGSTVRTPTHNQSFVWHDRDVVLSNRVQRSDLGEGSGACPRVCSCWRWLHRCMTVASGTVSCPVGSA